MYTFTRCSHVYFLMFLHLKLGLEMSLSNLAAALLL